MTSYYASGACNEIQNVILSKDDFLQGKKQTCLNN